MSWRGPYGWNQENGGWNRPLITPPVTTTAEFFSADSIWNAPLTGTEGVASGSAGMISAMQTIKPPGAQFQVSAGNGYGIPIYYADVNTPRYNGSSSDGWQMPSIPWPAGTVAASGEGYLTIVDVPLRRIYNFYHATLSGGQITFVGNGIYRMDGSGWWDPEKDQAHRGPWTGTSSNACYLAGCITLAELQAGVIPHALCMVNDSNIQSQNPVLPAKTTDSWINSDSGQWPFPGVPNGTRFRIRAGTNLNALGLGSTARIVAQAMKDYGVIFIDRGGGLSFRCQENANWGTFWDAGPQAGLTGTLLNYCDVLPPKDIGDVYDCPSTWTPVQPHL